MKRESDVTKSSRSVADFFLQLIGIRANFLDRYFIFDATVILRSLSPSTAKLKEFSSTKSKK